MKRTQISIRVSPATRQQLADLAKRFGSITQAVIIAVDRLWKEEQARQKGERDDE